jgi:hypothetical protein
MDSSDPLTRPEAEEAVRLARELRNEWLLAGALHALGWALARTEPEAARVALEESFELAGATKNSLFGSIASQLAQVRARTGDITGGLEALRAAFRFFADTGDRPQLVAASSWRTPPFVSMSWNRRRCFSGSPTTGRRGAQQLSGLRVADDDPLLIRLQTAIGHEVYVAARAAVPP